MNATCIYCIYNYMYMYVGACIIYIYTCHNIKLHIIILYTPDKKETRLDNEYILYVHVHVCIYMYIHVDVYEVYEDGAQ